MEAEMIAKAEEKVALASEQTEMWQKPKNGSVFPAKRRSVKKMIWDRLVKDFKSNNNNSVHNCTSELLTD